MGGKKVGENKPACFQVLVDWKKQYLYSIYGLVLEDYVDRNCCIG